MYHLRRVRSPVPDDVLPEQNVVDQSGDNVFALIGFYPDIVVFSGRRNDPVKLPAVVPDEPERLAILIFRIVRRKCKRERIDGVDLCFFDPVECVLEDCHPLH